MISEVETFLFLLTTRNGAGSEYSPLLLMSKIVVVSVVAVKMTAKIWLKGPVRSRPVLGLRVSLTRWTKMEMLHKKLPLTSIKSRRCTVYEHRDNPTCIGG